MADLPHTSFEMEEIGGWSLIQIGDANGAAAELERAVADFCGITAPTEVGGVSRRGQLSLIRTAPDRFWLIDDAGAGLQNLAREPATLLVIPLTEGRLRFRLTGSRCRETLAKCVAIDWEAPSSAPGRAVQTMLHRVPILLHRFGIDEFDLYVPRSFARSLSEWIADAALEFVGR